MSKKNRLLSLWTIVKIIWDTNPLFIIFSIPQIFIKSITPIILIYIPKEVLELIENGIDYDIILKKVLILGVVLLLINFMNLYLKNKIDLHSNIFVKKIKKNIGTSSMKLNLYDLEDTEMQNRIQLANKASELTNSLIYIQNIIANLITIISLSYIAISLNYIFILLIFLTLSVKIYTVIVEYKHNIKIRNKLSENSRFVEYLFNISFYNNGTAKEMRLNNLQQWYYNKNKKYRNDMVNYQLKSFKLNAFHNILTEIVLSVQSLIVLLHLADLYINGLISIADVTLYFNTILTLTICLSTITNQFCNFNAQVLNVNDYVYLKNIVYSSINENETKIENRKINIEFDNVSFAYPNTDKFVLKNINLNIYNNEKLAFVGMNGAGKTTLVKLLCKFYKPTEGTIKINNIDIWNIDNNEYYKLISAVFQDFSNFAFSIKDNIIMSEVSNEQQLYDIINKLELQEVIAKLPNGIESFLTKQFSDEGIELSGGQIQKIAIARAIYKNTQVIILDEPTSSLDPLAESEIYDKFINISNNKTAIFISHRLAISSFVDRIIVFENGEIIEDGNHDKLMNLKGKYYEMYSKQSENYN